MANRHKRRNKHVGAKKPSSASEGQLHVEFPGDASTREFSAGMLKATEGFFFPRDEE